MIAVRLCLSVYLMQNQHNVSNKGVYIFINKRHGLFIGYATLLLSGELDPD